MLDSITNGLSIQSFETANAVFLLGLILFLGTVGGTVFKRLKIPQVVGYIVIGIIAGQSGSRIISLNVIKSLEPVSGFALSLIGFMIGSELKITVLKKYGKQFTGILLLEALVPFFIVTAVVTLVSWAITGNVRESLALALILGAISSATAPAATTDVLSENRTKGPLTTMILGIVAMDDAIALILFAAAATVAGSLTGTGTEGFLPQVLKVLYHVGLSIALGSLTGFILGKLIKAFKNDEGRTLAFSLGLIMIQTGITVILSLDAILAAMAAGFFLVNFVPAKSADLFKLVDRFTPPVYVLFFVLVGAKLDIWKVSWFFALIAVVYIIGRTLGKSVGSTLGARITRAPTTVRKYLKWCLLSQAGVAIGLSISAGNLFPETLGPTVILIITATTFVVQLIGPICVRHGVSKAGECGLDITEEDLLRESSASDILKTQKGTYYLPETASFDKVVEAFSRQSWLSCPVCSTERKPVGIVTIDSLKDALLLGDLTASLLACDIMDPVSVHCRHDTPLSEVAEALRVYHVDSIPILGADGSIDGLIEQRLIEKYFHKKVLELHDKACTLETY